MPMLTVKTWALRALVQRMLGPEMADFAKTLPMEKGVQALVAQAISDNFEKEGPGWAPLKRATIMGSLKKKQKREINKLSGAAKAQAIQSSRMILQRSGVLKKSVTTPGARGNIRRAEGSTLVWGTDLIYAGIHNKGGTIAHPGTKNGFGMGIKIPPHNIPIPKREYLVLRPVWKIQLTEYVLELVRRKFRKMAGIK